MELMKALVSALVFAKFTYGSFQSWPVAGGTESLYIQIYNIHGLIRSKNLELGRNADTGGQTKYVLELGKALSRNPQVARVELVTRLIDDSTVSADYSRPTEKVNDKFQIVRLRCGGPQYLPKEALWPHLPEFLTNAIEHIWSTGRLPDVMHGHYADAGYVCTALKRHLGVTTVFTGHSLGIPKLERLQRGGMTWVQIEERYNIKRRVHAEEMALLHADLVITSTVDEKTHQYGGYRFRDVPLYVTIPPGLEPNKFYPYYDQRRLDPPQTKVAARIRSELARFYEDPNRPLVLVLCRPDQRKNIGGIVSAFGIDPDLQRLANLAVFAGSRQVIRTLPDNERQVLTEMLMLMDEHDLYGKMAVPKRHDANIDVPELYRIVAELRGVFVNPSFTENFGISTIEAAASGLPVVVTDHGGAKDILNRLQCGTTVDVHDSGNLTAAIKNLLVDEKRWRTYSNNGISRTVMHYSWSVHVERYLSEVFKILNRTKVSEEKCLTSTEWSMPNALAVPPILSGT